MTMADGFWFWLGKVLAEGAVAIGLILAIIVLGFIWISVDEIYKEFFKRRRRK